MLACSQWTSDEAHRAFIESAFPAPDPAAIDLVEPVRYRRYRSIGDDGDDEPGCLITATFDVDGPERQQHIVDRLIEAAHQIGPLPGARTETPGVRPARGRIYHLHGGLAP